MIRIRLHEHPLAGTAPRLFEAQSLGQWLVDHYGVASGLQVQVFAGEPSAETELTGDVPAILAATEGDYTVLQAPGSSVVDFGVDLTVGALNVATGFLIDPILNLLQPKAPDIPSNIRANRTQSSPNNNLGDRENKVRILERVEDIFGTVKSIPSLMMPTYRTYLDHKQYEYGYYCVSRGYCTVSELKDGDTLLTAIPGASAAVYEPFTSPNAGTPVLQVGDAIADAVVTVSRASEVDGTTLKALNQIQITTAATYTFTPDAGGDLITQAAKQPNFNAVFEAGDAVVVSAWIDEITVPEVGEWHDASHNVVAEAGADHWHVITPAVVVRTDYSGTYEVAAVGDGFIRLTTSAWSVSKTFSGGWVTAVGKSEWSPWVTMTDPDRNEVWVNIVAPAGMYKDNGGLSTASVEVRVEVEKSDFSTAVAEHHTISGATTDERAITIRIPTSWTGSSRVRVKRVTQYDYGFAGQVQDEVKWADLYAVTPVTAAHFGNKTTIHTVTRATARATAVKSRQLNCIASRRLPTFDGAAWSGAFDATGAHVAGTISATSRVIDILAAVTIDPQIGRRTIDELDVAQVWGVQQALDAWHAEVGQFNYTLDDDGISFEETVQMVANAAFCVPYRQSGKIRLAMDRVQSASTALFTHRNKRPRAETITRAFATDADFDGVELTYIDPDSAVPESIRLPLDGTASKPKKFELPGIRSFAQAWLRANREYYKLTRQRLVIETETTLDARLIVPSARVDIVDNTRFKAMDGEVIAQAGLLLTLSREVSFGAGPHSIVLMKRDGSLQSIACAPGPRADQVVLAHAPVEAVVTAYGADGVRTIFSFGADSARGALAWLVQEIDLSDPRYATVRAINYDPAYYTADALPIPDKASVIY